MVFFPARIVACLVRIVFFLARIVPCLVRIVFFLARIVPCLARIVFFLVRIVPCLARIVFFPAGIGPFPAPAVVPGGGVYGRCSTVNQRLISRQPRGMRRGETNMTNNKDWLPTREDALVDLIAIWQTK
ncbi:MAG: hypothetical protein LBF91_09625, partial [Azoarcus sp.]|nr:hypothetical protein [Azoarcus sp.]